MRKKIDNNNLIPWFMDDHRNLPADYLESCQRFFLELDRKQSEKQKGKHECSKKEERDMRTAASQDVQEHCRQHHEPCRQLRAW